MYKCPTCERIPGSLEDHADFCEHNMKRQAMPTPEIPPPTAEVSLGTRMLRLYLQCKATSAFDKAFKEMCDEVDAAETRLKNVEHERDVAGSNLEAEVEAMSELPEIIGDRDCYIKRYDTSDGPMYSILSGTIFTLAEWRELARAILAVPETGKKP